MSESHGEVYEHPEIDPMVDEEGNSVVTVGGPEPEPIRKGVMGTAFGTGALLILYLAQKWGLPMDMELALVIAGAVGSFVAWAKREYV